MDPDGPDGFFEPNGPEGTLGLADIQGLENTQGLGDTQGLEDAQGLDGMAAVKFEIKEEDVNNLIKVIHYPLTFVGGDFTNFFNKVGSD